MNKTNIMRWIYTFFLLTTTLAWAGFCVQVVMGALVDPTKVNVLEVAGVSILLGALISWCANVNQFWFRKKEPKEEQPI